MSKVFHMPNEIVDPDHERWNDFVEALLYRFEGCDATHKTSRAILQEMPGINVDGTLQFFESQGGFCDCDVLFYVVAGNMPLHVQQAIALGWIREAPGHHQ